MSANDLVVDASAMVDALAGTTLGPVVTDRLRDHTLHAPAHLDAEVPSALGRLQRAGALSARQVRTRLERLQTAPIQRHLLAALFTGAWRRRHNLRLVDALYAQLADDLAAPLVTTDAGLASAAPNGELNQAALTPDLSELKTSTKHAC